jgi:predicted permease
MIDLWKDLDYSFRNLLTHPGFTVVAVLSLGLGIGLNTTIFSLVNAVLLRPPAVDEPSELVEVYSSKPGGIIWDDYATHSYPDYQNYRDDNQVFSGLAGHSLMLASISREGRSDLVIGSLVTGNYFEVMGVRPLIGRTFGPEDDRPGADQPVVVLSHALWQRNYGSDPSILGKTVRLNGTHYSIVGILPPEFTGTVSGFTPELWAPTIRVSELDPIGMQDVTGTPATDDRRIERGLRWMFITGRLKSGVTIDQAQTQMATLSARLADEYPETNEDIGVALVPASGVRLHPYLDQTITPIAAMLVGVVGIVLLIACANVANMLLARATNRQREIAVRLAIGASRARLIRQLLVESLLLSGIGGCFGLLLSIWSTRLLEAFRPPVPISITVDLGIDIRVLLFTALASIVTGLIFGLVPALQASRTDLVSSLKEAIFDRRASGRFSLGNVLVVGQVALSLILLIAAGLMVRGLAAARNTDLGFEPDQLGVISLNLEMNGYEEDAAKAFYERGLERIRGLPGVESVTDATRLPLGLDINMNEVWVDGHDLTPDEDSSFLADVTFIGEDYFRTLGVPLLEGRDFGPSDGEDAPPVVVVNEAFARTFWPNETAVGKRIRRRAMDGPTSEIIGVSRNYKVRSVGEDARPYIHYYRKQRFNPYGSLVFRTQGDPALLLETVRRELLAMDSDLLIMESDTMVGRMAFALFLVRTGSQLFSGFSILSVLLAAIGLYGLIAYWVSQRTREIGIRMAIGADSGSILGLVVKRGMTLSLVGTGLGLAGAFLGSRLLESFLYGVRPWDPLTFAVSSVVLLGVAFLANAIPARRASRVDPLIALRYE